MKQLFLLALALTTYVCQAQSTQMIDTSFKRCIAVKVEPKIISTDLKQTDTITHVGFFTYTVIGDSAMTISYNLANQHKNIKWGDMYVAPQQYNTFVTNGRTKEDLLWLIVDWFNLVPVF